MRKKKEANKVKCKKVFLIVFVLAAIVAIVVGSVLGTRGKGEVNKSETAPVPTMAPTTRAPTTPEESLVAQLLYQENIISPDDAALDDPDSSISNALKFVSEDPNFQDPAKMNDETAQLEMKQRFAAATLFNTMKSDDGTWDNWMTDAHICSWYGIECADDYYNDGGRFLEEGATGTVISIDLAENGLTGSLPPQLFGMEGLETLMLFSNSITGEFPNELFSMPNLKYLDVDDNLMSGQISPDIGNLGSLEFLYISNNRFTGPIPSEIGKLTEVKMMWFSNNAGITGEIPQEIGNMMNLQDLRLDSLSLSGPIPTSFADLSLDVLSLENNGGLVGGFPEDLEFITGLNYLLLGGNPELFVGVTEFPPAILAHDRMVALSLSDTGLSTDLPEDLGGFTQLRFLLLDNNQMKGALPDALFDLVLLEQLNLGGNAFTGNLPFDIANLNDLTVLNLSDNGLDGNIPDEIGDLVSLLSLDLTGNRFEGELPESMGLLQNLMSLKLTGNWLSGAIPDTFKDLTQLIILRLDNNLFTETIPDFIGENMRSLEELWLHFNRWYDEETRRDYFGFYGKIPENLGFLDRLEQLYLQGNSLEGDIPDALGKLYNLKEFRFDNNEFIEGSIPVPICQLNLNSLVGDCDYDCGDCCTDCREAEY